MAILTIFLIVVFSIFGIWLFFGIFTTIFLHFFTRDRGVEASYITFKAKKQFDYKYYENEVDKEDYTIITRYTKTKIVGEILNPKRKVAENKDKIFICVHGIRGNRVHSLPYAIEFLKLGYKVLIYDQRSFGSSGGTTCSFGYYEKFDLFEIISDIKSKFPKSKITLLGFSMGAATVMQYNLFFPKHNMVEAIIEDSGYYDIGDTFIHSIYRIVDILRINWLIKILRKMPRLVTFFVFISAFWIRIFLKFWVYDVTISKKDNISKTPIFFVHGTNDKIVPVQNVFQVVAEHKFSKDLLVTDSEHVRSIYDYKEKYIKSFLDFEKIVTSDKHAKYEEMFSVIFDIRELRIAKKIYKREEDFIKGYKTNKFNYKIFAKFKDRWKV